VLTCNGEADTRAAPVIKESEVAFGQGMFCLKLPSWLDFAGKDQCRGRRDAARPLLLESL